MAAQKSMKVTIPATEVHRKFGDLVRRVFSGKEHFVVERDGLPVAVILSVTEYETLLDMRARQERMTQFQTAARAIGEEAAASGLDEAELMAQLEEVRQNLHDEHYGE